MLAAPSRSFPGFSAGQGPPDIVSGASFSKNRLRNEIAQLSTLFEDNWVLSSSTTRPIRSRSWPRCSTVRLTDSRHSLRHPPRFTVRTRPRELRSFVPTSRQPGNHRRPKGTSDQSRSRRKMRELFWTNSVGWTSRERCLTNAPFPIRSVTSASRPSLPNWRAPRTVRGVVAVSTCERIWRHAVRTRGSILEREQRRLLLSSAIRLGHPMIDLWLLHTKLTGTLAPGRDDEAEPQDQEPPDSGLPLGERLSQGFVDLLDCQRHAMKQIAGPTSFANCTASPPTSRCW